MIGAAGDLTERSIRHRLLVRGIVQGVGFRPFVYQLARRNGLAGYVQNTAVGVVIEIEGTDAALASFAANLPREGPPLMLIATIEQCELPAIGEQVFAIRDSQGGEAAFAMVPPDIRTCEDCLAETRDPADRRFEYPFTNCTNCGPRYSIILDVPYDRAQTTMAEFAMCAACQMEYEDPNDRRFHAQPNACPVCGPRLRLTNAAGEEMGSQASHEILRSVADRLRAGQIVAWKGLGGYQLACDAGQAEAVAELRRRKRRNEKPFALMVADMRAVQRLCEISPAEEEMLCSPERPILLLTRRPNAPVAAEVSPGNPRTGVMLPCTPMHALLFDALARAGGETFALVMTSGNLSEEPIALDDQDGRRSLAGVADAFVAHNRRIHTRVDDSVVRVVEGHPMLLRRARGYAPLPLPLPLKVAHAQAQVLACGAQQKSALCLTRDGIALLSQHIGDLENYETLQFFEQTLERMQKLFHVQPQAVVHDLHPRYLSTQFAMRSAIPHRIGVQHHHAHIASCMAEHGLQGPVIGVAWDGTGYGTDGTIWGGEFLLADLAGFRRFGHLRTVPLAGGDTAVREPWRVARGYLHDTFDNVASLGIGCPASIPAASVRMVDAIVERRIQTIETSSCGRLFDAVASLIGLHQTVSFEGQAAVALEAIADDAEDAFRFAIDGWDPAQVDMRPMLRQIVDAVRLGVPASRISAQFHNTLVAVVSEVCERMREHTGTNHVCLSGGCFQNLRLLLGCLRSLRTRNFEVFFQQRVPTNDGGIAFGQAAIACELLQRGT